MVDSAIILSGTDPYSIRHGGNLRTRALAEILDSLAVSVEVLFPERTLGKIEVKEGRGVLGRIPSLVRVVKRHYIPMPTAIGARNSTLRRDILARSADLMVICVVCHAQYVRRSPALLWLDYMDVGSAIGAREAVQRSGIASLTAKLQSRQLKWSEKRVSARAGLVTAAGWADYLSLRRRGINAHWIPTPLPDEEFKMLRSSDLRTRRTTVGFLANFDYWPNRDAYQNLRENWLPRLRRYGYEVIVAGRGSEALVTAPSGLQIIGAVGDVDEFYRRVDITLAPMRKGGGMKVKVLESLTRGIPVIGTNFAFEGFPASMLKLVRVCEEDGSDIDSVLAKPIPHVQPDSAELRSYRMSTVRQRVAELLEEIYAPGGTCSPVLRSGADRAPDIATGGDDARDG
jgi:glycosyltransferase involved in cell wall biosynthesis